MTGVPYDRLFRSDSCAFCIAMVFASDTNLNDHRTQGYYLAIGYVYFLRCDGVIV